MTDRQGVSLIPSDIPDSMESADLFTLIPERFAYDPLGYVYFAFPWGQGILKGRDGPDAIQIELLEKVGELAKDDDLDAALLAVASGHGIGKTTTIAWVILWFMSTRPHPQAVVTANTKEQLSTKTWRELSKWHKMAINGDWFTWTATRFYLNEEMETWFAAAIPWSKERDQAFAGTHETHVLIVFDEASLIDDGIWTVTEGALTTQGAMWLVFGNPTRNTGRFYECFHKYRHRWNTYQVDSRKSTIANQKKIAKWIEDYGEDSDFIRVRVKGQFPRSSVKQLISIDTVEQASRRILHPTAYVSSPRILGVDTAREGDDQTAFIRRQGLQASRLQKFRELKTQEIVDRVAREIVEWKPDAVFIDMGYIGSSVYDLLRGLGHKCVTGVWFGGASADKSKWKNKRSEMWCRMGEWMSNGGSIPDDQELKDDLMGPEYYPDDNGVVQLEAKDDMKDRGLASPDSGDALALTFAYPVAVMSTGATRGGRRRDQDDNDVYDPLRRKSDIVNGGWY